jgi:hypothetical protein
VWPGWCGLGGVAWVVWPEWCGLGGVAWVVWSGDKLWSVWRGSGWVEPRGAPSRCAAVRSPSRPCSCAPPGTRPPAARQGPAGLAHWRAADAQSRVRQLLEKISICEPFRRDMRAVSRRYIRAVLHARQNYASRRADLGIRVALDLLLDCPGRKPPFSAVKRFAPPYKSPIQNPIYCGKR